MASNLQVDVYTAPAAPIATGHSDPSKRCFSPISCTLIQGPTSAVLVDTPATVELSEGLAAWIKKTAPSKKLLYIYTTHLHGDHFLGNPVILRHFPEATCVATISVVDGIRKQWPGSLAFWDKLFPGGQIAGDQHVPNALPADGIFHIDGHLLQGIDVPHSDTDSSSFLHVPDLRLVVCGDIVYGDCYQFLAEANTPEKRQMWLQSLDQIAALDPQIVVPGHKRASQIDGSYLIEATRAYILAFEEELAKAETPEKLEEAMIRCYPQRWNRFLLEQSCQRTWSALGTDESH
ncbi:metallo-beta-lactamase domain-containing protein [Colletotrichum musicola]|uniref:Metallo-beta-lactamase domain-containing protein n=1 Tax=Colletotrichum musicola TaxID=2175873 RepID=A0A8H6KA82_9PEZI|nr:metallo-beta-lactamase domain-containing protein [Colletotrichum musicola]